MIIGGSLNIKKTKKDIKNERQAEFDDEKLGERALRESKPGRIMADGLKIWKENKDKKPVVKEKNVLAGMDILTRKWFLDCNRLMKIPENLFRRLLANKIDLIYIIECLIADEKIDAHNFKYKRIILPYFKMILRMARRIQKYKSDEKQFEEKKNNLLLELLLKGVSP